MTLCAQARKEEREKEGREKRRKKKKGRKTHPSINYGLGHFPSFSHVCVTSGIDDDDEPPIFLKTYVQRDVTHVGFPSREKAMCRNTVVHGLHSHTRRPSKNLLKDPPRS